MDERDYPSSLNPELQALIAGRTASSSGTRPTDEKTTARSVQLLRTLVPGFAQFLQGDRDMPGSPQPPAEEH